MIPDKLQTQTMSFHRPNAAVKAPQFGRCSLPNLNLPPADLVTDVQTDTFERRGHYTPISAPCADVLLDKYSLEHFDSLKSYLANHLLAFRQLSGRLSGQLVDWVKRTVPA